MTLQAPRARFRAALLAVGNRPDAPAEELVAEVAEGLRAFDPGSPESLAVAEQLSLSSEDHPWGQDLGLCLKDYEVRLAQVVWLAGDCDIPEQVQRRWPELARNSWEIALRLAKLVLLGLESPSMKNGSPAAEPARAQFRAALVAIGDRPETPPDDLAAGLVAAMLAFASETPDNLEAAQQLGVTVERSETSWDVGIALRPLEIRLSSLLGSVVGSPMPEQLLEDLPELIQEDWDTVFAATALILTAFESDPHESEPGKIAPA